MYEHTSVDQEKEDGESIVKGKSYQTKETSSAVAEPEASSSSENMPEIEKKFSDEKLSEPEKKLIPVFWSPELYFQFL